MNRHWSRHDTTNPGGALGFTILEMIVVLGLLVIVAGFAAPFLSPDRFRMDAAALEVSTTLHSAQRKGVLRGHHVRVVFDTTGRRVTVHMDANNDGILQGSESVTVLDLEAGVTFGLGGAPPRPKGSTSVSFSAQSGLPTLQFHRNGSSSQEGIFYLTSERTAASSAFPRDTRAIEVERSTGRIRCFSYDPGSWEERC